MMSNIIKCFDVVILGKVNIHVFLISWQKMDHSLDLLPISHSMPNSPQFTNHVRHHLKMLPHRMILMLLVAIKFEGELIEPSSEGSSILNLHSVLNCLG